MAVSEDTLLGTAVRGGLIESHQLEKLRMAARKQRQGLMAVVQAHYRFPLSVLYRMLAEQNGLDFVEMHQCKVMDEFLNKIPPSLVRRKQILPVEYADQFYLAIADPFDRVTIDSVQRLLAKTLVPLMVEAASLNFKIDQVLSGRNFQSNDETRAEPDLIALLDRIIREAYLNYSSDIHLLVEKTGLRVRLRVDGKLRDYPIEADAEAAMALISRVKVLSDLDIAEQRQAQDGGFSYHLVAPIDCHFNIRVATVPIRHGERVTMRLLNDQASSLSLSDLGMLDADLARFKLAINQPYGLILLTGPTGSGKSTTLCAALQEINQPDVNIMTVENPIEYVIPGVSQVQTGSKMSFASALRSFLRHDPDVLMVGEIRDHETADVALKAAMTGHRVFSTLHTNNAMSAVTRLADIGCDAFLIASTVTAVIAQRLVRRLCPQCRQQRPANESECQELGIESQQVIYQAVGCALCQGSGYRGRLGLFETLWFDDELARLVSRGEDEDALMASVGDRLHLMWDDGVQKVLMGMTTLDELRSVAMNKNKITLAEVADG